MTTSDKEEIKSEKEIGSLTNPAINRETVNSSENSYGDNTNYFGAIFGALSTERQIKQMHQRQKIYLHLMK